MMNSKRFGKKWQWPIKGTIPKSAFQGLRRAMKNLRIDDVTNKFQTEYLLNACL
jgi:hypothetical protein